MTTIIIMSIMLLSVSGQLEPHTIRYDTMTQCEQERAQYRAWGFMATKCVEKPVETKYSRYDAA